MSLNLFLKKKKRQSKVLRGGIRVRTIVGGASPNTLEKEETVLFLWIPNASSLVDSELSTYTVLADHWLGGCNSFTRASIHHSFLFPCTHLSFHSPCNPPAVTPSCSTFPMPTLCRIFFKDTHNYCPDADRRRWMVTWGSFAATFFLQTCFGKSSEVHCLLFFVSLHVLCNMGAHSKFPMFFSSSSLIIDESRITNEVTVG